MSSLLQDHRFVTDGGLETDLLFHRGLDLPEFAAFPLLGDPVGVAALEDYYTGYAEVAAAAGTGLMLETPTWRANPDWAERIGVDRDALERAVHEAVALVRRVQSSAGVERCLVTGVVGPRGDGYVAGESPDPDEAASYHRVEVAALASAGVDAVHAMTMTTVEEAVGVVWAARSVGLPAAISFTLETDGRLPDGSTLRAAVERLEVHAAADWYAVNCAHPTHVAHGLDGGDWQRLIRGIRPNASTLTHAELDAMVELDEGDPAQLRASLEALRSQLPGLQVVGGCCGTDVRHVAALWGVDLAEV